MVITQICRVCALCLAVTGASTLPLSLQVRNEFYKDTQGVILVYDVGQKESFDALDTWLAEMKQELGPHGNMENIVFVVCANKVGCGREPGCGAVLISGS